MEAINLEIEGLILFKPVIYKDNRGYFLETQRKSHLNEAEITDDFVQENESLSIRNVIRGLHFQVPPHPQAKLLRVVKGKAIDVAVDLRKNSPTYGKYLMIELNETEKQSFYIPIGFAHGFISLADETILLYKCSDYYSKECEKTIAWDDPTLNIPWNCKAPILSDKDRNGILFDDFNSPF
ncbi:MAG: dTDP-4-dehydrorhamnose 3,5-epimerase [Bacteroidales bacterium]